MWTKSTDNEDRPLRDTDISQRGFRRLSVRTGGIISDTLIMIVDENTNDGEQKTVILDYEQATKMVQELQRFIDVEDDLRENYKGM